MVLPVLPLSASLPQSEMNRPAFYCCDPSLVLEILYPIETTNITLEDLNPSTYGGPCYDCSNSLGLITELVVEQLDENMNVIHRDYWDTSQTGSFKPQIMQGCKWLRIYNNKPICINDQSGDIGCIEGCQDNCLPMKIPYIIIHDGDHTYTVTTLDIFMLLGFSKFQFEFSGSQKTDTISIVTAWNPFINDKNIDLLQDYPIVYYCNNCSNIQFTMNYYDKNNNQLCTETYDPESEGNKHVTKCSKGNLLGLWTIEIVAERKDTSKPASGTLQLQFLFNRYG